MTTSLQIQAGAFRITKIFRQVFLREISFDRTFANFTNYHRTRDETLELLV